MERTSQIQSPRSAMRYLHGVESTPPVEVEKSILAPLATVWEAWSTPSLIKQWWGPEEYTSPSAKADFREGGKYTFAMESESGEITWGSGTYEEIIPNQKISFSDHFSDAAGNYISPVEAGMPEWKGSGICFVTVEFHESGGETKITLVHNGIPVSMHDECVEGWSSSLDKLKRLAEAETPKSPVETKNLS